MTAVWALADIERVLPDIDPIAAMAAAFSAYSRGDAIVPPVGELLFEDPPGDAHIKYGYVKGDRWFVIKVATGFYTNPSKGLPPNSGLMLVFDAQTGLLDAVLLDEGHLTNVRTAAAGALAASLLAPPDVTRIGVVGSGLQARMQVEMLARVLPTRDLMVLARDPAKAARYAEDMTQKGYTVGIAESADALGAACRLIVTTTASTEPLLAAEHIRAGTHVTAMGSDTADKTELAPSLLAKADLVVADSFAQCRERGEIHHALAAGAIDEADIVELGTLVDHSRAARSGPDAITVCDLTGVAVQDIEISKAVLARLARGADA